MLFRTHYFSAVTQPKRLFVFVHGFYASGRDLLGLAPYFSDCLKDCLFLAPDAPKVNPFMPESFYWYRVDSLEPAYLTFELKSIMPDFAKYMDELKQKYRLNNQDIYLYGFSQGALLILHYGLTQAQSFAGIVAHSGGLVAEGLSDKAINKSSVCLIHGIDDAVIPYQLSQNASGYLNQNKVPNQLYLLQNLGHSINHESIEITRSWLVGGN
jgi:phospholipase/carboxylesterase